MRSGGSCRFPPDCPLTHSHPRCRNEQPRTASLTKEENENAP